MPHQKNLSTNPHAKISEYPVLAPVSGRYPKEGGRLLTCYSPVRHSSTQQKLSFSVRLACVKHAASVRPEPGSNSPNKNKNVKAQKNQPTKTSQPAIPTKNTQKQKTGIKQKQTHYRVHKQHPHIQTHAENLCDLERCFAPSSHDQASRFVRCRSAQQEELYALARRSSNRGFLAPSAHTSARSRGFRQDSAPHQAIFPRFSCPRTQNVTQSVCQDALQTARRTPLTWRYSRTITFFAQNFTAR